MSYTCLVTVLSCKLLPHLLRMQPPLRPRPFQEREWRIMYVFSDSPFGHRTRLTNISSDLSIPSFHPRRGPRSSWGGDFGMYTRVLRRQLGDIHQISIKIAIKYTLWIGNTEASRSGALSTVHTVCLSKRRHRGSSETSASNSGRRLPHNKGCTILDASTRRCCVDCATCIGPIRKCNCATEEVLKDSTRGKCDDMITLGVKSTKFLIKIDDMLAYEALRHRCKVGFAFWHTYPS